MQQLKDRACNFTAGGASRTKGFTLIELMIVVVIIAILASIAMPSYKDYVLRGKIAEAQGQLASLQVRMEQYYQDNRSYANGTACGIAVPASTPNFSYACTMSDNQHFVYTATGLNGAAGFVFTVNEAGTKATTGVPTGWTTNATCWVKNSGGC